MSSTHSISRQSTRRPFTTADLKYCARCIRDRLERQIAARGPEALDADTIVATHNFLLDLCTAPVTLEDLRESRIHLAVQLIRGKATRWPHSLIDVADRVAAQWTMLFGKLIDIRPVLYEPGGRLCGIAAREDISRSMLVERWENDHGELVSPLNAHAHGDLGFQPGAWWLCPIFAYRDGIVNNISPEGQITYDGRKAYAVTMGAYDEISSTYDSFVYRPKVGDRGIYGLLAALLPPKPPIRVLRMGLLHSQWAPSGGLRYDGLYDVTGYSMINVEGQATFDVYFKRCPDQRSFQHALAHPNAEERDDLAEYKRIREEVKLEHGLSSKRTPVTELEESHWPIVRRVKTLCGAERMVDISADETEWEGDPSEVLKGFGDTPTPSDTDSRSERGVALTRDLVEEDTGPGTTVQIS